MYKSRQVTGTSNKFFTGSLYKVQKKLPHNKLQEQVKKYNQLHQVTASYVKPLLKKKAPSAVIFLGIC